MGFGIKIEESFTETVGGIYIIRCSTDEKVYVGRSFNIRKRIKKHKSALSGGRHRNKYLQRAYDLHGKSSFEYYLRERLPASDEILHAREVYWVKVYGSLDYATGFNLVTPGSSYERNGGEQIHKEDARLVIKMILDGETNVGIERKTGINKSIVSSIRNGTSWRTESHLYGRLPSSPSNYKLSSGDVRDIKNRLLGGERREDVANRYGITEKHLSGIANSHSWGDVMPDTNLYINVAKLTESDVKKIKEEITSGGKPLRRIASDYDVSVGTIGHIKHGRTWNNSLSGEEKAQMESRKSLAKKIPDEDVPVIVSRISAGEKLDDIASDYGVSPSTISAIKRGKRRSKQSGGCLPYRKNNIASVETVSEIKKRIINGESDETIHLATGINVHKIQAIRRGDRWAAIEPVVPKNKNRG